MHVGCETAPRACARLGLLGKEQPHLQSRNCEIFGALKPVYPNISSPTIPPRESSLPSSSKIPINPLEPHNPKAPTPSTHTSQPPEKSPQALGTLELQAVSGTVQGARAKEKCKTAARHSLLLRIGCQESE